MRSPFLSPVFLFAGFLYKGVVHTRNRMYDARLLAQRNLPRPVISIGNITMGGSGKTPLVIHIAQTVSRLGATPALLSRGYRRAAKVPVILPPHAEPPKAPAQLIGDEPALVRRYVPNLWLGISKNRHAVGMEIARQAAQPVFILDDGFQHRQLRRDLDIVVLDKTQPLRHNRILPSGTLREPIAALRRADIVIINGREGDAEADPVEDYVRNPGTRLLVLHAAQEIACLEPFEAWRLGGNENRSIRVPDSAFLVAAIGNPQRFCRDMQNLRIEIKGCRFFRDHATLSRQDWLMCAKEAGLLGAQAIITTEKDAIKISFGLDLPLLVAIQSTQLVEQGAFERILESVMAGNR